MRFLLDESAEYRIAAYLSAEGHDVTAISHDYPHALPDSEVLTIAHIERRILITNDRDFGELIFREQRSHAGVIYFRLGLMATAEEKMAWLSRLLITHGDRLDQFLVVTDQGVRLRSTR